MDITGDVYLYRFDNKDKLQNRATKKGKIIMFLDNATTHRHLKLGNVKLEFFPPYFTSKL